MAADRVVLSWWLVIMWISGVMMIIARSPYVKMVHNHGLIKNCKILFCACMDKRSQATGLFIDSYVRNMFMLEFLWLKCMLNIPNVKLTCVTWCILWGTLVWLHYRDKYHVVIACIIGALIFSPVNSLFFLANFVKIE